MDCVASRGVILYCRYVTARTRRQLQFWILSLSLAYTLFGFYGAPWLLRKIILWKLPDLIGRPVKLQKININPYAMSFTLGGFQIAEQDGSRFVGWDEVYVNVDPTGLLSKEIVVSEISISNAFGRVQINKDGTFNFSDILARFPSEPSAPRSEPRPLPIVRIGSLRITGAQAVLDDFTRTKPFHTTVGPIDVALHDFSTIPSRKAPYAFTAITESGETFSWSGHFFLDPLRSDGKFAVDHIVLRKYAPIYDEFLHLTIRDGTVGVSGNYRVEFTDQLTLAQLSNTTFHLDNLTVTEADTTNPVVALANLTIGGIDLDLLAQTVNVDSVQTRGDRLAVRKLVTGLPNVAELVKKGTPTERTGKLSVQRPWQLNVCEIRNTDHRVAVTGFLGEETNSWQSLQLNHLRLVTEPLALSVDEIVVVEPRADVVLPAGVAIGSPAGTNSSRTSAVMPSIRVGTLIVSNATLAFGDHSVQPNAGLIVTGIQARVTGFTTDTNGMTELAVSGRVDNTAPFTVTGRINPFNLDANSAMQVAFKGIDLTAAGPYAGKYAGYLIRKGKVSFDLNYDIRQRALVASNSVLVDQFTFGEATGSPDATKLPVRLAVAILKDRNGQIKLDVPIEGHIDDPKFRYWGAVWQVVGGLLTKIATAPFSMLGSMFGGGGDELGYQQFAAGSAVLLSNETKKLDVLVTALTERPGLSLEITGSIDPVTDREPLQRAKLRVLALQRAKDYATGLRQLYVEALPRLAPKQVSSNVSNVGTRSRATDLPTEEMERQYLPLVELTDEDYRPLAAARVASVAGYLKVKGQLADDRLLISPRPAKDGARVNFSLQ